VHTQPKEEALDSPERAGEVAAFQRSLKSRIQQVDPRGQLYISKELQELTGIEPGTFVLLGSDGPGQFTVSLLGNGEAVLRNLQRQAAESLVSVQKGEFSARRVERGEPSREDRKRSKGKIER